MSVTLAVSRFRSRDFKLLAVIRRIASYALSRNVRVIVRWVPSEYNPSDRDSRVFSDEELEDNGLTNKFEVL